MAPSAMRRFCYHLLLAVFVLGYVCAIGDAILQGLLAGASCFRSRHITGCNETLLRSFKTNARSGNPPDTKFFLFTQKNRVNPEFLHNCGGRLPENTFFNPGHKTEIFVHGWLDGTCRTAWMREMRDELLMRGDGEYNIILVDWTWGNTADYVGAASNNRVVGKQIAFVVNNIIKQTGSSPYMFHIIGQSFGAHIAGFAGKLIPGLRRITALDPANSPYRGQLPKNRLAKTDARIVDVIHTSDTNCTIVDGFGYPEPLGTADFYPNGGYMQRGDSREIISKLFKLDLLYGTFMLLPNFYKHLISIQYYKASINPCGCQFIGVECGAYQRFRQGRCRTCGENGTKCAVMGMDFESYSYPDDNRHHTYYLTTDSSCPYCNNKRIIFDGFSLGKAAQRCKRNFKN